MSEPVNPATPERPANAGAPTTPEQPATPGEPANAGESPNAEQPAHAGNATSTGNATTPENPTSPETAAANLEVPAEPRDFTTMLIAFDGSGEARHALEYAAALLRPRHVEILTAWEPLHRQAARAVSMSGLHQADWGTGLETDDPAYEQARAICREGVEVAESLGLKARAHMVESATTIWSAIVDATAELRPDVIVTGTRAISGFKSLWQSSTADNIVHNARIPVFVVPPMDCGPEEKSRNKHAVAETDRPAHAAPTQKTAGGEIPQVSGMNRNRTE